MTEGRNHYANMTKGNDNPSMTEGMVNSMFDSMNYGKNLVYQ